jgi:hypothetical protein
VLDNIHMPIRTSVTPVRIRASSVRSVECDIW